MTANKPLSRAEIKALPLGFTPTAVMPSRKQMNAQVKAWKAANHTNRKRTPGRQVQYVPVLRDMGNVNGAGEPVKTVVGQKQIIHGRRRAIA